MSNALSKMRSPWSWALFVAGMMAMLAGLVIMAGAWFSARTHAAALAEDLEHILVSSRAVLGEATNGQKLIKSSAETLQAGTRVIADLPPTMEHVSAVLREAAATSFFAGKATEKADRGLAGLALPDPETGKSAQALKGTAARVQELAKAVDGLARRSEGLATQTKDLAHEVESLLPQAAASAKMLKAVGDDLDSLHHQMVALNLPLLVFLVGLGVGALFFLLGMLAVGLAYR